jgi:hypothetical protein
MCERIRYEAYEIERKDLHLREKRLAVGYTSF